MSDITINGYIVHDTDGLIHGYGATAAEAWLDMKNTMRHANIRLLGEWDDSGEERGNWVYESELVVAPATAALLQLVEDHGGNCSWGRIGRFGIACTVDEELA